ncbi:MAG: NYN domain-containing protein [Deltaproteobacteria bacterium]|nr:NYN domain-containing protein [Deltaproteobacteria bacterium]
MKTYIYIDGFNFYYSAVKNTPYKWLDFKKLFQFLLPNHQIISIKYFTANVSDTNNDRNKSARQKTFIRALKKYIPEIFIYYGKFLSHNVCKPLAYPIDKNCFGNTIGRANVIKTEEKGSDVNLALHLLNDAWLDLYDCAVVVSNDSDLAESLNLVKNQRKKVIGLITPGKTHPSRELMKYSDFNKRIRKGALAASQLPDTIPNTTIHKPLIW